MHEYRKLQQLTKGDLAHDLVTRPLSSCTTPKRKYWSCRTAAWRIFVAATYHLRQRSAQIPAMSTPIQNRNPDYPRRAAPAPRGLGRDGLNMHNQSYITYSSYHQCNSPRTCVPEVYAVCGSAAKETERPPDRMLRSPNRYSTHAKLLVSSSWRVFACWCKPGRSSAAITNRSPSPVVM